ncbi:MAG: thermonuclease family protein [Vicinamibacteria bacterium]
MLRLALVGLACLSFACRASAPDRYWSRTCVSGDGRYLLAGGDHAALVDAATGAVAERKPGMVKAVGCDRTGGIVVGYGGAFRLPGGAPVSAPELSGDMLATTLAGAWISTARTVSGGQWRGPASIVVQPGGGRVELSPALFGAVGAARTLPTPDSFAVRFGSLLDDGRVLMAAGWQPSRSPGRVEPVPWGFFAWDLDAHAASPLTGPIASDPAVNQGWMQRIAATPDAAHLAVATHDGERLTIARFARGARSAASVVSLASKGAAAALALSRDGSLVAIGSESRGRDAPSQAFLLDASGATVWTETFAKTVAGVHFLPDGSLIVAGGDGRVVKPALPARPLAGARTAAPRVAVVTVEKVIDGDTVLARGLPKGTELVRLIGVNAPETGKGRTVRECFGAESARWLTEQVPRGSQLRLEFDVGERDRFGRLLAYAYRPDGTFVNAALVRNGYAQTMTIPPNVAHADELRALERTARQDARGLWSACR